MDNEANLEEGASPDNQAGSDENLNLSPEEQIANMMDDNGEFKQKTKKDVDDKEDEDDSSNPDSEDEHDEDTDDDDSEDDDSEDGEDEDEDEDDGVADDDSEEEPEFESLEEIAEAAGMTVEQILGMVKGKIKVKGEEQEVTFDELLKGQMLESDYRLKTSEHAENVRAFEADKTEATQVIRANVQEGVNILRALEAEYLQINKDTDWQSLKEDDPNLYHVKRGEVQERAEKLKQFKAGLKKQHDSIQSEQAGKKTQEEEAYKKLQADRLKMINPAWIDEKVSTKEISDLRTYLKTAFDGDMVFTDSDVDGLTDARLISLLTKARLYDEGKKSVDLVKKKLKKTRKITKSGGKKTAPSKKVAHKNSIKKAISSGKESDATAAIAAML